MINRQHRFHGRGSLRFVYQRGQVVRGQYFSIKYSANNRRQSYRAAVVVSRKVHKSAVVRNRIRRRLYEVLHAAEPHIAQPFDIVITVYSEQVAELEHPALVSLLCAQLEKAGILRTEVLPTAPHDIVDAKEKLT